MVSLYRSELLIRFGNFMFRYRNMVFPVALIVIIAATPPGPFWGNATFDPWIDRAALLVAILGETLRVLTVGLEYIKRGGLNKQIYAQNLVTEGMFAHCRNPLYVGNIMLALALLTISARLSVLVIGGVLVLLTYLSIVAAEEKYLRANFPGEYEDYCRRANRWLPDFRGFRETLANSRFNWRRVLLKESGSIYVWIVAAVLLDGLANEFALSDPGMQMFTAIFVAATIAYATIQILKRTQRLHL